MSKKKPSLKSKGLRYKLLLAYFLFSVIPALFVAYLLGSGFIQTQHLLISPYKFIGLLIGIGALMLMSISAVLLLYRSISSLEDVTKRTVRFVKEISQGSISFDSTEDETEKLNTCFIEMIKEIHHKVNEANKYAVALGETNKRLSQMAVKDGLTQLYNHIYIKERLNNEIKRAEQFNQSLSILMIDIDNFKRYNDDCGHLAGDYCLGQISLLIQQNIRLIDIPARYGGEEFLVILPGTNSTEALQIAENIRKAIANYQFSATREGTIGAEKTTSLTVSIGVASYFKDSGIKTENELILAADTSLLTQAKKRGKNQVALYV
ncbi:MAG: GGDEF domain-containing protein [Planctomycetota bacterium]|nr:GGDEF domain-containing protein [Planctomycetota bacterium]MDI6787332.1 GGDEF domain-containing protein [Planctomycetota bacterium]